jgi:hypothetical protein
LIQARKNNRELVEGGSSKFPNAFVGLKPALPHAILDEKRQQLGTDPRRLLQISRLVTISEQGNRLLNEPASQQESAISTR